MLPFFMTYHLKLLISKLMLIGILCVVIGCFSIFLTSLGLYNFIHSSVICPEQIIELKFNPNMIQLKTFFKKCVNKGPTKLLRGYLSEGLQEEPWVSYKKKLDSDLIKIATTPFYSSTVQTDLPPPKGVDVPMENPKLSLILKGGG